MQAAAATPAHLVELFLSTWSKTESAPLPELAPRLKRYTLICMLAKLLHEHGHSVNTTTIGQLLTAAHRNTQSGLGQTHLQYNGWSTTAYNYKTTTFACALPFPSTSA